MTHRTHRRAFTLVEMLVVVAIISILTAIAVPTLNRIGVFGRDPLNVASRQVLTMLKAARIYAGTHNVDTAVVYSINRQFDAVSNPTGYVDVIDGAGIVRRLKPEEVGAQYPALVGSERGDMLPFVPIKGQRGLFEQFPRGAVMASYTGAYHQITTQNPTVSPALDNWADSGGFCAIRLLDAELQPVLPRPKKDIPAEYCEYLPASPVEPSNSPNPGYVRYRFPAHVFKPSGILQTPNTDRSRYEISLIPSPEGEREDRFYGESPQEHPLPPESIEIFGTIGRIQSIDREPGIS